MNIEYSSSGISETANSKDKNFTKLVECISKVIEKLAPPQTVSRKQRRIQQNP